MSNTVFTYSNSTTSISTNTVLTTSSYTIPAGEFLVGVVIGTIVTSIGTNCFQSRSTLTSVIFDSGSTCVTIGVNSFRDCTGLTSFSIPNSVTNLHDNCFDGCILITSLIIPSSVTRLGTGSLANTGLYTITIHAFIQDIGSYIFYGCLSLSSVIFLGTSNLTSTGSQHFLATSQPIQVRFLAASSYNDLNATAKTMVTQMISNGNVSVLYGPPCFLKGTKILAMIDYIETWVPIENLKKGDFIKTYKEGFIPIDIIGYKEFDNPEGNERGENCLYIYKKELDHPTLLEDLIITGTHSVLVRHITPEQKPKIETIFGGHLYFTEEHYRLPACVDERCQPYGIPGKYTIYHFALENNDYYMNYGVYANGMLVESSSKRYMHEIANMSM